MMTLVDRLRAHVRDARLFGGGGPTRAVLAVSGGADSVALLDLLHALAPELDLGLIVAHADHGVQRDSRSVAQAVARLSDRYGLPCEVGELALGSQASETAARRARYAWLRGVQARHGARWLVTAHHADDQVETVLLRVLRGSAPAGLAGITARGRGGLRRPLLPFARRDLVAHVTARDLPVHDDPANRDPRHLRSWVRGTLLPLLSERLGPGVGRDLLALARHATRDRRAWAGVLELLPDLDLRITRAGFNVARGPLGRYDDAVAVEVLRAAARRAGLVLGPRRARAVAELARGESGRSIALGQGWRAEAVFDRLLVGTAPFPTVPRATGAAPAAERGRLRFGRFQLAWRPEPAPARLARDGWTTWITDGEWQVRPLAPGDRLAPVRGVGRREVRRLLSEARVPRAARRAWPVVVRGDTILWVPGICRGAAAVPGEGTEAVRLDVVPDDRG